MMKVARKHPESDLQRAVSQFLQYQLDPEKAWWFHVPNGTKLSGGARSWKTLESLGAVAGVPDMTILMNPGGVAFIELKVGKNKLSDAQEKFSATCERMNINCYTCRSVDDVRSVCRDLGILKGHEQ
jgi:hypothetical protein